MKVSLHGSHHHTQHGKKFLNKEFFTKNICLLINIFNVQIFASPWIQALIGLPNSATFIMSLKCFWYSDYVDLPWHNCTISKTTKKRTSCKILLRSLIQKENFITFKSSFPTVNMQRCVKIFKFHINFRSSFTNPVSRCRCSALVGSCCCIHSVPSIRSTP